MQITIGIAPRTKKNSQQIFKNHQTGQMFIAPSKAYKNYEAAAGYFIRRPAKPIDYPVNVKCTYYMPNRRRVDLVNLEEATLDVLVRYGVLKDDCSSIVVSMDGSAVLVDKEKPRTEIEITEVSDDRDQL